MQKRKTIIFASVTCGVIVVAGLATLIWWLVTRDPSEDEPYVIELLKNDGIGTLPYTAAFTSIPNIGKVFWWFYPSVAAAPLTRPVVLWLDGVTGLPPSLLANLGMVGPYDYNLQRRNHSWINHCNLLFVDAPIGTGFSTAFDENAIPSNTMENALQIITVLESFYSINVAYRSAPLYIFGQGDGAKTAVELAARINELNRDTRTFEWESINILGVGIGNGIISPATNMLKLGLYLEELGYIDDKGRSAIENVAQETDTLVNSDNSEAAFENFISLGNFVNENAGAVAVNLKHIVEKLTQESSESTNYFSQYNYIRSIFNSTFMNNVIGPALGINSTEPYDSDRDIVVNAVKNTYMTPYTTQIQNLLQNSDINFAIYNGNLDAITNTPALDFVKLMQGFYNKHPEFEGVPLYIYGQSYGGKMAVDMALRIREAEKAKTIQSKLKGIAMGNAWIHPVDLTLSWGPLLFAAGLVDQEGLDEIQLAAREAERLFNVGEYFNSTAQWAATQGEVQRRTTRVDFYNILTKMPVANSVPDTRSDYELSRDMLIRNVPYMASKSWTRQAEVNLDSLMNNEVKKALNIPDHVVWGGQSGPVFDYLRTDFMKPVTEGIEQLLDQENPIIITKYNGNLDLICATPGQITWVDRLKWHGAEPYKNQSRVPIWENSKLEGYYKAYGPLRFFWINVAGHSVPRDNPDGSNAFLRDMTSFG